MTGDRYTDAWLSELWGYCRELPESDRERKRDADRKEQRQCEEMTLDAASDLGREAS